MIRQSELELHARAKALFESEHPGRLWRAPVGSAPGSADGLSAAGLIERQNYLARVRAEMRAEGKRFETETENPPQLALGG